MSDLQCHWIRILSNDVFVMLFPWSKYYRIIATLRFLTLCRLMFAVEPSEKSVEIMRKFSEQYARRSGTYFCVDKGVTSVVIKVNRLIGVLFLIWILWYFIASPLPISSMSNLLRYVYVYKKFLGHNYVYVLWFKDQNG